MTLESHTELYDLLNSKANTLINMSGPVVLTH